MIIHDYWLHIDADSIEVEDALWECLGQPDDMHDDGMSWCHSSENPGESIIDVVNSLMKLKLESGVIDKIKYSVEYRQCTIDDF